MRFFLFLYGTSDLDDRSIDQTYKIEEEEKNGKVWCRAKHCPFAYFYGSKYVHYLTSSHHLISFASLRFIGNIIDKFYNE